VPLAADLLLGCPPYAAAANRSPGSGLQRRERESHEARTSETEPGAAASGRHSSAPCTEYYLPAEDHVRQTAKGNLSDSHVWDAPAVKQR